MSTTAKPTVLVVDDDRAVRYTISAILKDEGLDVLEAENGVDALEILDANQPALIITDLRMPKMDGMTLLAELAKRPHAPRAIMVTAHGSERMAVDAMKRGALDYFAKPFNPDEVCRVVRRSLETTRLAAENEALRAELALSRTMVFRSDAMRQVAMLVERVGPRNVSVLVTGESGTGKELVARAIVRASDRAEGPYVRFNCAAIRKELAEAELFGHSKGAYTGAERARPGLFREADGGTLLLDEVAELDPQTQGALLRVLQEREVRPVGQEKSIPVDVRIVAATHSDLKGAIERGSFREDLYYRLHVVQIHIPPLRDRREDIVPLAEHFAARAGERFGLETVRLTDRVLKILRCAPWPGNVRELEHVITGLVALSEGPIIDENPFAEPGENRLESPVGDGLKAQVAAFERGVIAEELARSDGNQSETARRLGISRVTLIDKLNRYELR